MDDVDLDESFHSDFSEELNLSVASMDDDASSAHLIQSTSSDLNGIEPEVKLRKRGRPRKSDPLAATTTVTLKDRSNRSSDGDHLKSRRVRAEKAVAETENDTPPSSAARASPEPSSVESETTSQAAMDSTPDPQIVKRGRGRPKKSISLNNSAVEDPEAATEPTSSTLSASSDLPESAKKSVENTGEQSLVAEQTVEMNGSMATTDDEATTTSPAQPSSSSERRERRGRPRKHQSTDTVFVPEVTVDMPPQDTVVVPTVVTEELEDDERMDLTMDTDTVSPVPSVRRGRPTKTAKKKKRISLSSLSTDAELIAYLKKNKKGGRYLQMMLQKKKKMELMMLRRGTPTVPVPLFERPGRGKKNLDVVMDSEATSSGGDVVVPEQEVAVQKEEVVVPVRRPIGRPRKDQNQSLSDTERSPNGKTQTPIKPSELTIARVEERREKKTEKAEKGGEEEKSERVSKRERRQTEHFDTASSSTVTGSNVSYESVNGKKIRTVRIARTSSVSEAVDEQQSAATRSSSSSVDALSVPLVTSGDSTVPIIPTVPSKRTRSMTSVVQNRKSADRSMSSNNEIFGHAIIKRPSISSSIDRRSTSGIRSRENSIRGTEADADSIRRSNSTVSTRSVTLTEKPTSTVSDTDLIKKTKNTVSAGSAHKSKSDVSVTEKEKNADATAKGAEKSKSDVSSLEKPTSTVPTPDTSKKTNTTVHSAQKVKSSSAEKEPTVSISDWPKKFSIPVPTVEKAEKTKSADKKPTSTVPTPTPDSAKKANDTGTTLDSVEKANDVVLPIDDIKKSTPAAPTEAVTKKEKTTVSSLNEEKTTVSHLNKEKSTVSHLKIGKRPHRSLPVEPERRSRNYPDTSGKERELRRERKKVKTFESEFGASYLKGEKKVKKEESSTKEEKEKHKETEDADAVVEHLVGVIMKEARKQGEPSVTKTSESARRKSVQKAATTTVDAIILPEEDKEKEEKPSSEERSLRKRKATQVEEGVVVPEKRAKRESAEKTRKSMESEDTQRKEEKEGGEKKMEVEEKPAESSVSVKKWKKDKLSIQQQRRIRKLLQNAVYNEQRRKRRQEDRERREKGLPPLPRSPIKTTTVEMPPVSVSTPLATGKRRSLRERKSREEIEKEEKEREEMRMNNKSIMPSEKKEEEEGKEETPEGDEVEDASEQGAEEENMADGEDYDHEDDLPLAVIQNNTRIPLQVPETPRLRQVVNLELPSFSPKLPEGDDAYPDRDTHLEIDMAILRPMVRIPIPCPPREIIGMDSDDEFDLPDIKIRREKYILMNKGHEKRGRGKPRVLGGTPEVRIINIRNEMERLRSRFQALCEEATGILPELGENSVTRAVKHLMGQGPKDHVVS